MGRETEKKLGLIERNLTELDMQEIKRLERNIDEYIVMMEKDDLSDDEISTILCTLINDISQDKEYSLKQKYLKMTAYINNGNKRGFKFWYHSNDGKINERIC